MKNNELFHYGTPRHSGRYPYGSGEVPYQHPYQERKSFLAEYSDLKANKLTDKQIADAMGLSVDDMRKKRSIAMAEVDTENRTRAMRLRDRGYSYTKIGQIMGGNDNPISESTIRGWCKQKEETRKSKIDNVSDLLEDRLKKGEILDVGLGSNFDLGVTKTTFDTAIKALEQKGYVVNSINIPQPNSPGNNTTIKYIAPAGMTKGDVWKARDNIKTIMDHSPDGGITFNASQYPQSIDASRVKVVYAEEGGVDRDGMIGIRRGVKDLSLGNDRYSQVRIGVNDTHYIKGMAIYDDNVPDGYDVVVYSNKHKGTPVLGPKDNTVLKPMKKDDSDNPFGANIKAGGQSFYPDKKGKYIEISPDHFVIDEAGNSKADHFSLNSINKLKEEGDWGDYRKNLPAQVLSKQPTSLIKTQLDLTYSQQADEFNEIMSLSNPVVKQKLLNDFAEGCDKKAKHLDAAALPRQVAKVIIPVPELKDNEIYAPTYKNGETLVLIRFPHAGTFEIPTVIVNNNNKAAKNLLGNAPDAVGINKAVADRLSGADFDGDTVLTIPVNDRVRIKTSQPLEGLKDFDPKEAYPKREGMNVLKKGKQTGTQMGIITNLITDMSLQNPTDDELARAVRHSMVVIDAAKHELDWKASEEANGIAALKKKYQKHVDENGVVKYGGASTLLSRLGNATKSVDEIELATPDGKKTYSADPETGKKFFKETGKTYFKYVKDKDGNQKYDSDGNPVVKEMKRQTKVSPLDLVDDARLLSSGTVQEELYANHINKMRALANEARKASLNMETLKKDPAAAKLYAEEVSRLTAALNNAVKSKPLERQAQIRANLKIAKLTRDNPDDIVNDKDKYKKTKARLLTESRIEVGAGKEKIKISAKEWQAIQAHAVSKTLLKGILDNCDMDEVRKLATPGQGVKVSDSKISLIKSYSRSGLTISDIAKTLNLSPSTVSKYIKD